MNNENIRTVYVHDEINVNYDIKCLLSCYGLTDDRFNRIVASSQLNYREYLEFLPVTSQIPEHLYNCLLLNDLFNIDNSKTKRINQRKK